MAVPSVGFDGMDINDGTIYAILPGVDLGAVAPTFSEYRSYAGTVTQANVSTASLVQMSIPMKVGGTSVADLGANLEALNVKIRTATAAAPHALIFDGVTYSVVSSPEINPPLTQSYQNKFFAIVDMVLNRLPTTSGVPGGGGGGGWSPTPVSDDPYNVNSYGTAANGITDDTDAIQNALDYVAANPGTLYFPPGTYLVTNFDDITAANVHLCGAGREATVIKTVSAGPVFSLGTYDSTPATPWVGTGVNFQLSDMTIQNDAKDNVGNVGVDQTSIGIQDNGSGSAIIRNVWFKGLLYGIYAPYGHDVCTHENVMYYACTTGLYLGPGSEQISIRGGQSALHDRAIVIEGAFQGSISDMVFCDAKTRDIDILCPDALESGITVIHAMGQVKAELSWTVSDCWFETGAYGTGWVPVEHVRIGDHDDTGLNPVRGVTIRDSLISSGASGMGSKTGGVDYVFVNADNGTFITIDGVKVEGSWIEAIVKTPVAAYSNITVRNAKVIDGNAAMPAFAAKEAGNVETSDWYHAYDCALSGYVAPTITGARDDGTALANLLAWLAAQGIIVDSTTAS